MTTWSALDADQLRFFYQPQVDAAGVTVGLEALLHWKHPVRGRVSPGVFIPLAGRLGMRVIAEGVETEEQANWLWEHGCRRFQGYLYARPAPLVSGNEALPGFPI